MLGGRERSQIARWRAEISGGPPSAGTTYNNGKKEMAYGYGSSPKVCMDMEDGTPHLLQKWPCMNMGDCSVFDLRFIRDVNMNGPQCNAAARGKRAQSNDHSGNYAAATSFPSLLNLAPSAFQIERGRGAVVRAAGHSKKYH